MSHSDGETKMPNSANPSSDVAEAPGDIVEVLTEGHVLRLFVTGSTPRSLRAITNLQAICEEHLAGRYTLEVVDLYQQPEQAKQNNLVAAPTLIKSLPDPVRRVIGDMSDEQQVLVGLDVEPI
jgi:circadian clock protein KaiB